jgi:hypothetical protein
MPHCLRWERQELVRAVSRVRAKAGSNSNVRIPITLRMTSSSSKVKALSEDGVLGIEVLIAAMQGFAPSTEFLSSWRKK